MTNRKSPRHLRSTRVYKVRSAVKRSRRKSRRIKKKRRSRGRSKRKPRRIKKKRRSRGRSKRKPRRVKKKRVRGGGIVKTLIGLCDGDEQTMQKGRCARNGGASPIITQSGSFPYLPADLQDNMRRMLNTHTELPPYLLERDNSEELRFQQQRPLFNPDIIVTPSGSPPVFSGPILPPSRSPPVFSGPILPPVGSPPVGSPPVVFSIPENWGTSISSLRDARHGIWKRRLDRLHGRSPYIFSPKRVR